MDQGKNRFSKQQPPLPAWLAEHLGAAPAGQPGQPATALAARPVSQTRQRIEAARAILQPSRVRLGHVPNWLRFAAIRRFGCPRRDTSGFAVLQHAQRRMQSEHGGYGWFDHWGSTRLSDGRLAFVSEVYSIDGPTLLQIQMLAEAIGCLTWVDPNSWHYPGQKIRLVLAEKPPEPPSERDTTRFSKLLES